MEAVWAINMLQLAFGRFLPLLSLSSCCFFCEQKLIICRFSISVQAVCVFFISTMANSVFSMHKWRARGDHIVHLQYLLIIAWDRFFRRILATEMPYGCRLMLRPLTKDLPECSLSNEQISFETNNAPFEWNGRKISDASGGHDASSLSGWHAVWRKIICIAASRFMCLEALNGILRAASPC